MASSPRAKSFNAIRRNRSDSKKNHRECQICGRTFSKTEHLERHVRSHTKEKPFTCPICGRKYGRNDTLLRHQKDHSTSEVNAVAQNGHSDTVEQVAALETSALVMGDPVQARPSNAQMWNTFPLPEPTQLEALVPTPVPSSSSYTDRSSRNPEILQSTTSDSVSFDFDTLFPSWMVDEDFQFGLIDTPIFNSMADLGPGWSNISYLTTTARQKQVANLQSLWPTHVEQASASQPDSGQGTPQAVSPEVDERYRETLQQRLLSRPLEMEQKLPSAEFLNLCVRSYFARFHPVFPVIHAPTFRPSKVNATLLLSICSVGSLFTGSPDAVRQGIQIFERLHRAVVANWQRLIWKQSQNIVAMVQTALIGQTFGLLSGEAKHLAIVDTFHGTSIAWARRIKAFTVQHSKESYLSDTQTTLDQKWRAWAHNEELLRIAVGLQIQDAELANIFHHRPFLSHHTNQLPVASSNEVFMASRAEEWHRLYLRDVERNSIEQPTSRSRDLFDQLRLDWLPKKSQFTAYAALEGISTTIVEYRITKNVSAEAWHQFEDLLIMFYQRFLKQQTLWEPDDLGMIVQWHSSFMSLFADFDLLEKAIGREGPQLTPDDQMKIADWANSKEAKRCVIHGSMVQKKLQTMPVGSEPAIHVPRAMFRAGIAWYCYTRYGSQDTMTLAPSALNFTEFRTLGIEPASVLFEAHGYKHGRPSAVESNEALCGLADLLRRIGHWEIARKYAAILSALIHSDTDDAG